MNRVYLSEGDLPFCPGCGHKLIAENLDKALQELSVHPLDVVMVTDIGCHGIIDQSFKTHTVHGLHGRSVALATGISICMDDPTKKVIVFIGDGGSTIGLQHLLDSAHKNINLTVILHNNMLYGMTGGQPSDLTPLGFKTPTQPGGCLDPGLDICELMATAGASWVRRIAGIGDFSGFLRECLSGDGFRFAEVIEICPSYGLKANPGMKLRDVMKMAGYEEKQYATREHPAFRCEAVADKPSLLDKEAPIAQTHSHALESDVRIMISGSAGEGVQVAAEFFTRAAITAGLNVTKKGSYPVTVGVGYSSSDIIISPKKILYTGSPSPDVMVITSADGLEFSRATLGNMKKGLVLLDDGLELEHDLLRIEKVPFRQTAGVKSAAIMALWYLLKTTKYFPEEAFRQTIEQSRHASKIKLSFMEEV